MIITIKISTKTAKEITARAIIIPIPKVSSCALTCFPPVDGRAGNFVVVSCCVVVWLIVVSRSVVWLISVTLELVDDVECVVDTNAVVVVVVVVVVASSKGLVGLVAA